MSKYHLSTGEIETPPRRDKPREKLKPPSIWQNLKAIVKRKSKGKANEVSTEELIADAGIASIEAMSLYTNALDEFNQELEKQLKAIEPLMKPSTSRK